MAYEVGSFIDLTYLNKKREVASNRHKKSSSETSRLWTVGSKVIFTKWFPTIETIVVTPA